MILGWDHDEITAVAARVVLFVLRPSPRTRHSWDGRTIDDAPRDNLRRQGKGREREVKGEETNKDGIYGQTWSAQANRKNGRAPPLSTPSWPIEPSDDMPEQQTQPGRPPCSSGGSMNPTEPFVDRGRSAEKGWKSFGEEELPAEYCSATGPPGAGNESSAGCRS